MERSTKTLADWLADIEGLHPADIELGLSRVTAVAARLGLLPVSGHLPPSAQAAAESSDTSHHTSSSSPMGCPVITVAGTNGKGSTVTLIERLARATGRRTGLYTSPHILRFNERVKVDGREVDDDLLVQAFEAIAAVRQNTPLTYFEYTTLAALWVFRQCEVEIAILEVGLGGRLDAVNIVDADVAVVTSVGIDHTDWLGSTREQIAQEKAGIARAGRPLLYGEADRPVAIDARAQAVKANLLAAGRDFGSEGSRVFWHQQGQRHELLLSQDIPLGNDNLATALQALACLDVPLDELQLEPLASAAQLAGRSQRVPLPRGEAILDVGHNVEALSRFLRQLPPAAGRRLALCGMLSDKPAEKILPIFANQVTAWHLATLSGPRGRASRQLAALLPPDAPAVTCHASVADALHAALAAMEEGDQLLIFGSFVTVSEASELLGCSTG